MTGFAASHFDLLNLVVLEHEQRLPVVYHEDFRFWKKKSGCLDVSLAVQAMNGVGLDKSCFES